jgi:hypothetical protein
MACAMPLNRRAVLMLLPATPPAAARHNRGSAYAFARRCHIFATAAARRADDRQHMHAPERVFHAAARPSSDPPTPYAAMLRAVRAALRADVEERQQRALVYSQERAQRTAQKGRHFRVSLRLRHAMILCRRDIYRCRQRKERHAMEDRYRCHSY